MKINETFTYELAAQTIAIHVEIDEHDCVILDGIHEVRDLDSDVEIDISLDELAEIEQAITEILAQENEDGEWDVVIADRKDDDLCGDYEAPAVHAHRPWAPKITSKPAGIHA